MVAVVHSTPRIPRRDQTSEESAMRGGKCCPNSSEWKVSLQTVEAESHLTSEGQAAQEVVAAAEKAAYVPPT